MAFRRRDKGASWLPKRLTFEVSIDDLDDHGIVNLIMPLTFLSAFFIQCGLCGCDQTVFFEEVEVRHDLADHLESYVGGSKSLFQVTEHKNIFLLAYLCF